jgi:hypothetical protein
VIWKAALTLVVAFVWFWRMRQNIIGAGRTKESMIATGALTEREAERKTYRLVLLHRLLWTALAAYAVWAIWT